MLAGVTKRSRLPSSGVMKPKPFSSLNPLTVPVGMWSVLLRSSKCCHDGGSVCEYHRGLHLHLSPSDTDGLTVRHGSTRLTRALSVAQDVHNIDTGHPVSDGRSDADRPPRRDPVARDRRACLALLRARWTA